MKSRDFMGTDFIFHTFTYFNIEIVVSMVNKLLLFIKILYVSLTHIPENLSFSSCVDYVTHSIN